MSGYSGKPLATKLGFKPGMTVLLINAPASYKSWLGEIAERLTYVTHPMPGLLAGHLFFTDADALTHTLVNCREQWAPAGFLWVSWPKRSAGVPTDITEDRIRGIALPMGWVDIKVCAVDPTWSALKLVIRKSQRNKPPPTQ
ncbi:MAG: hypothetical protein AABY83_06365 [Pseudomonadota bacterium]